MIKIKEITETVAWNSAIVLMGHLPSSTCQVMLESVKVANFYKKCFVKVFRIV